MSTEVAHSELFQGLNVPKDVKNKQLHKKSKISTLGAKPGL
jgi:hypothetical protein